MPPLNLGLRPAGEASASTAAVVPIRNLRAIIFLAPLLGS
jgi:hypothetical protein